MADNSDVPPLEDMSDILKKASAIRVGMLNSVSNEKPMVTTSSAKDRAKVKKNVAAKTVNMKNVNNEAAGDHKIKPTTSVASTTSASETASSPSPSSVKVIETSSKGVFGGLKKGFLFGDVSKSSSQSTRHKSNIDSIKPVELKVEKLEEKTVKDDIPFICHNSDKIQSSLTLSEVQQAMSEAKGLLDNQDWINDDLLSKVEKNELLLRRFADPNFMKALGEFQTNPTAAMEKYKGNTEVEKFLVEFCHILGDHFTSLDQSENSTSTQNTSANTESRQSKTVSNILEDKRMKPKITEIVDNTSDFSQTNNTHHTKNCAKESPKIIELADDDTSVKKSSELHTPGIKNPEKDIVHHSSKQSDIDEMKSEDAEIKQMLNNPQVMEILLDPKVMNLIQLLKTDPASAQRTVDTADADLNGKIKFLVSKGLLQFQTC